MVQIQKYLKKTNDFQSGSQLPLLNSLFIERFSALNPYSADNNFKTFISWVRKSPQIIGFARIIANDILSDSRDFKAISKSESARNKILNAKAFWDANKGLEITEETLYDLIFLGIGYNWVGKISEKQAKEFCGKVLVNYYPTMEKKEFSQKLDEMVEEIKLKAPEKFMKKWRHIAASTVTMLTDEYEVKKYIQRVGVNVKEFEPDEILKFKLMPLDGKVYPYPPLESLLAEVYLLWLITQNNISFFENGGTPDNVFILPKELAGSKNHAYLIETLKKYKKIQNKHGQLVFTGDLKVERLMEVEAQMQNKDLGLYIVGVLAMFYGVPVTRIPFLVGKAASGGDAGGLADSGYWRMISVTQTKLEEVYNSELWRPFFGVEFEFSRGYLQDEVRETQNEMQKTQIVEQRLRLGLITIEEAARYLNIDADDLEEAQAQKKERDVEEMKTGMLGQNLENDGNVIPNQDNRNKRVQKQKTQNNNQTSAGGKKINP